MRVPQSRLALEGLQWFGLFAGPLAFAGEHVIGVGATLATCNPGTQGWDVAEHTVQLAAMGVAALVVLVGEAAAYLVFLATKDVDLEGDPPCGRMRFLSTAALVIGPIMLTIVLLSGLGAYSHNPCRQA
jgi:hypothetical protein